MVVDATKLAAERTRLAYERTLMAWVRTSVSMIGFGFTIYNFYRGFLEELAGSGRQDAARNLGVALVAAGTITMVIAIWNYWIIERSLKLLAVELAIPPEMMRPWVYAYVVAAIIMIIGLLTLVFALRGIG